MFFISESPPHFLKALGTPLLLSVSMICFFLEYCYRPAFSNHQSVWVEKGWKPLICLGSNDTATAIVRPKNTALDGSSVTFCVWLYSLIKFSRFLPVVAYQHFISFCGQIILYFMEGLFYLFSYSSVKGSREGLLFLHIKESWSFFRTLFFDDMKKENGGENFSWDEWSRMMMKGCVGRAGSTPSK